MTGPLHYGKSETSSNKHSTWEAYPEVQVDAYTDVMEALIDELSIQEKCNVRHEDIDPGRKVDPGPALQFKEILDDIYSVEEHHDATYWASRNGDEHIA